MEKVRLEVVTDGDLWDFADPHETPKQMQNNTPTIFKPRVVPVLSVFIFILRLQQMLMTNAPDELWLFLLQEKNSSDPQFEPHAWTKMAQVLGSLVYSCGSGSYCTTPFEILHLCQRFWKFPFHRAGLV